MDISALANLINAAKLQELAGTAGAFQRPYLVFVVVGVAVLVLYGLSAGRTRVIASLIATYVAYTLTVLFPFTSEAAQWLPNMLMPAAAALLFLVFYALAFFALRFALSRTRLTMSERSVVPLVALSVAQIGVLSAMAASLVAPAFAQQVLGMFTSFLAGQWALFAWAAGTLVLMIFLRPHSRE